MSSCVDGSQPNRFKCKKGSIIGFKNAEDIKADLFKNGPVSGVFQVQPDFYSYKSGVYYPVVFKENAGWHAVKVIGYGVENDLPYWLCANSWGPKWGDQGFIKIKQGVCEINKWMNSCQADL